MIGLNLYASDLDRQVASGNAEPDPERETEDSRETSWRTFVAAIQAFAEAEGWPRVQYAVGHALEQWAEAQQATRDIQQLLDDFEARR